MSIHLIPGLGATSALYEGYDLPGQVQRADYPPPQDGQRTTFAEYAQFLIRHQGMQAGDSLIGMSLGGMMACEISKWLPISKITLISSCTDRQHLNPMLRHLSFMGPHLPWGALQRTVCPLPGMTASRRIAVDMFREANTSFVRWACTHAADWNGLEHHPDLLSIHGDRDPVFPIQRQQVQRVISGGSHLMVISHREEILPLLVARHGESPA